MICPKPCLMSPSVSLMFFSDWEAEAYENRTLTEDDYVFRRHGLQLPMTPNSFTWRMKLILKKR